MLSDSVNYLNEATGTVRAASDIINFCTSLSVHVLYSLNSVYLQRQIKHILSSTSAYSLVPGSISKFRGRTGTLHRRVVVLCQSFLYQLTI